MIYKKVPKGSITFGTSVLSIIHKSQVGLR